MKKLMILFSVLLSMQLFAQAPDPPFNPMTAPGASGISTLIHTLYWNNPENITYNEVYFSDDSSLVANMDTSVRVKNGYPSTIFSSYSVSDYGTLSGDTKYFWKVVEINAQGSSLSPLWYFYSFGITDITGFEYDYTFDSGFDSWQILGPQGFTNWYWSNTTHTLSSPGEVVFRWDPVFIGDSYFMSPTFNTYSYSEALIHFKFYEDWWSDTVVVGCGITTDDGINWTSVWERQATGNVGPEDVLLQVEIPDNFRLGFYYTGDSNNIDFLYIDDISITAIIPLTPPTPPAMLTAIASETQQKVSLIWTPGWAPDGLYGYKVQRKTGAPESDSAYITILTTDLNTLNYNDFDVQLNQNYTYRVRSLAMGFNSQYGNEATAYVPAIVPVELLSFSSSVLDDDVTLNWITATETNNSGFQVERRETKNESSEEWLNVAFVNGNGTSTEPQTYSYKDENLSAGKYQYRLKQIDFDGTFEYSNIVDVEILPPAKFSLEQNYPNPFNPVTTIKYSIPNVTLSGVEGSRVQLKIFDVLGNEVAILADEYKSAGKYEIEFNANKLSSGVYYYQLKAGDPSSGSGQSFIQTRKMILLK